MAEHRLAEFRFALGRSIGMGHLRRSEAVAVELALRGWETWGLPHGAAEGEPPPENVTLPREFPIFEEPPGLQPDLVVADSYLLTAAERAALKAGGARLVSFLDAPAADPADLVVDVNVGAEAGAYVAAGCPGRVLAGPDYFPVRPALNKLSRESRDKNRLLPARRLLVTFGGSDWHGLAVRVVSELAAAGSDLDIRVAAGDIGGGSRKLLDAMRALPGAELVPPGSELAEHFAWADMAISAAGLTKYELALFGVPAIIVAVAENQEAGAEAFASRGCAFYLGRAEELAPGALGKALGDMAVDSLARAEMSSAGKNLVDGLGAARVADELEKMMEGVP